MSTNTVTRRGTGVVMAAILAFGVVGCQSKESEETRAADTAAATAMRAIPPDSMPTTGALLTDAEIAQIVLVANSADSSQGELAIAMSKDAEVKSFARTMVKDHGALNKQAIALTTRIGLTPLPSDASTGLQRDAENEAKDLGMKTGTDFNRAYIDGEVAMHQRVLDSLDLTLIPQAQNADLKALLQQARGAVAGHLERAKNLQKSLVM